MKFTVLASLLTVASAINSRSSIGKSLLSKSRALNENAEQDMTWMIDYSLRFESCHTVEQYNFGENGEDSGQTNLVKFKLCPSNKCGSGCKGAEYVATMEEFVDSYTEWQMNDQEYKCEMIRENCDCTDYNGDDDACEANCYSAEGMYSTCVDQEKEDGEFEFDLQEYLECKEIETGDEYTKYYVGPKCSSNHQKINLGVFTDEYCTQEYDDGIFATTYGITLPYSSENIVSEYCISCSSQNANNDGSYEDAELTEICDEQYQNAAKCETRLSGTVAYPDTDACEYINKIKLYEVGYKPTSKTTAVVFATILGLGTVGLAAYAIKMRMDGGSRQIKLNDDSAIV
jgi:hypothetical protein